MSTEPLPHGILTLLGAEGDERERDGDGAEQTLAESETRGRADGDERQRRAKQAEFRAVSVEMREPELAGRARNYIGARSNRVRLVKIATRTETKEKERARI